MAHVRGDLMLWTRIEDQGAGFFPGAQAERGVEFGCHAASSERIAPR
jgi:hypothetical protein